jgi:two-component system NtrC family response regulator
MVLIIDDDIAVCTSLALLFEKEGFAASMAHDPRSALELMGAEKPELVILDMNFSNDTSGADGLAMLATIRSRFPLVPVVLITGWATIDLAVKGMKMGAADFLNKPWQNLHLLQTVRTLLQLHEPSETQRSRQALNEQFDFGHIIGEDPALLDILETVGRVAKTDASVLITGESGTGKELIAEAIHQNSPRRKKPFVKVNLGGISSSLFESEMFGHVRGAFTDARHDRVGRFELADKGSIFLDEIGDLDLACQVKLLRVLQDRTYEVLGSSRTKYTDTRVICATNRPLEDMVASGAFREDLYYRINLATINLPPLRRRSGDIVPLARHFLANMSALYQRDLSLTVRAQHWLAEQPLPGNIRQLKNMVERAVLASKNDQLDLNDFSPAAAHQPVPARNVALPEVGTMTLEEMEIQMIRKAMERHKGNVAKVARALGLTRSALYRRFEKFQIPYQDE